MKDWFRRSAERWKRRIHQRLPDRMAVEGDFRRFHGRNPRLEAPITFNEKIAWRKLYERDPRMSSLIDKVLAKEHVARLLGPEWVIPTLWHGPVLPPRSQRNWPIPYVLKANHGSHWNYFVSAAEDQQWDDIEAKAANWMRLRFGVAQREWGYQNIRPQLLVEPYIGAPDDFPINYKFWTFSGKVKLIHVCTGFAGESTFDFYDLQWRRLPIHYASPHSAEGFPAPASLDRMIAAAESLCGDFTFMRADFYEIEGRPLFSEMTFYPNSGRFRFSPESADEWIGSMWKI